MLSSTRKAMYTVTDRQTDRRREIDPFNGPLSRTTQASRYQKGKTNLDFTEARDSEWQWHQLGQMQVCTSLQTNSHASTRPPSFLQTGCPSCRPTNSVKAVKAMTDRQTDRRTLRDMHTDRRGTVYARREDGNVIDANTRSYM